MSKKTPKFYEILNKSAETKTVDLLIYGAIPSFDEDSWRMKNTAEVFVRDFKAMEKDYDRINIHINSPGGSLYHGFPIFNVILNSKKDVHTYNDGLAASMGGLLLLAGKTVHTAKNALLMIHNSLSFSMGNAEDLREQADMLDKYDGIIAQLFADKSGKDLAEIKTKYLNYKDHFLTADEAKEEGFVDFIEEYESEDAPPSNISNMAFSEVMALYSKEEKQESFLEKVVNHVRKAFVAPANVVDPKLNTPAKPTIINTDMNFETTNSLLEKEVLSAEDILAIKAEVSAYRSAGEKFSSEEVTAQITAATDALSAEITLLATAKAEYNTAANALSAEKDVLTTEKTALETKNATLETTIAAYRKSGVSIDNTAGDNVDPIQGSDPVDSFYSETDAEVKRLRAEAGITSRPK